MKAISAGILGFFLLFEGIIFGQDFWEQTAGPEGGWVRCILVDRQSNIYAGFNAGTFGSSHLGTGIYKSTDAGLDWQPLAFPGNKDIQSIVLDSTGTVFLWSYYSGVYKSTNGGSGWTLVSNGVDGSSNGKLCACRNNFIVLANDNGVSVTTNSGFSWSQTSLTDPAHSIFVDNYDNIFAGVTYGGLYKSTDYGQTWNLSDNGLYGESNDIFQMDDSIYFAGNSTGVYVSFDSCSSWNYLDGSPAHISALAKGADNEIFAATQNNGFYVSTNMGIDWQHRNNGLKNTHLTSLASFPGNIVITGTYGDGLFMSGSLGQSWQPINTGIKCVHATAFLRYKQYLFAGSQEGMLYKSSDLGDSWTRLDSTFTYMPVTAFLKTKNNSLFFASWADPSFGKTDVESPTPRVFKSTDEGATWTETAQIYVNSFASYYDQNSGTEYLLAAADFMGMRMSTDDGNTWYSSGNGIDDIVKDVAVNSSGTFFASTQKKVFRSTDIGTSWQLVYEYPDFSYKMLITIAGNDYIYGGLDFGGVVRSTDNGDSWMDLNSPLYGIISITTDSLNRVYAGSRYGDISRSFNNGELFISIGNGMIGGPIMTLECDNGGNIFTGPYGGSVYRGASNIFIPRQVLLIYPMPNARDIALTPELKWHPSENADLYEVQVSPNHDFDSVDIVFDSVTPDTACIVVDSLEINTRYYWRVRCSNSFGWSIWSQLRSFWTINPSHTQDENLNIIYFDLAQNYPNPFNPTTRISFNIPKDGYVSLKVYNILGQEVASLVNGIVKAGSHEVTFSAKGGSVPGGNIDGLPSGVYIYKLTAGSYSAIKKMVVLK